MNKAYVRRNWRNEPSTATALNETNLNAMDAGIDAIDNRVLSLDLKKLDASSADGLIKRIGLSTTTGIMTIVYFNNTVQTINTGLSKVAINIDFDTATNELIIELQGGEIKRVPLSALITQYTFENSDTVHFTIDSQPNRVSVSAEVVDGGITAEKLNPDYLAALQENVRVSREQAEFTQGQAQLAQSYTNGTGGAREDEATDNAKSYMEQAREYMKATQASARISVPQMYIDFSDGCLKSEYEATGIGFWVDGSDGCLYGEVA